MSVTTQDSALSTQDSDSRFRHIHEQFVCPNEVCEASIPTECVFSNIDRMTGIRHVKVICEKCNHVYAASYKLDAASSWYVLPPGVEEVTDPRRINGVKRRLSQLRGELEVSTK